MAWSKDILKKIRILEIQTRPIVNDIFSGSYTSGFQGSGMVFEDFREYVSGDDVRSISWQLTAKTGKAYIKKFKEEKQRALMLAIDVSGSQFFGTAKHLKSQICTFVAATLCFSGLKQKEPVGLLLFSDQVELFIPPKTGRAHIFHILEKISSFKPQSLKSDFNVPSHFLKNLLKKKTTIFFLSDFLYTSFQKSLNFLNQKHEVICFALEDSFEKEMPSLGLVEFFDLESNKSCCVDTSCYHFKKDYKKQMNDWITKRNRQFQAAGASYAILPTDKDLFPILVSFFKKVSR